MSHQITTPFPYTTLFRSKLVLCILHDMDFAAEVFEKTIVLNEGKVLLNGLTHDVFTNKDVLKEAHLDQPSIMHVAEQFGITDTRSEEHTSELQSRFDVVC